VTLLALAICGLWVEALGTIAPLHKPSACALADVDVGKFVLEAIVAQSCQLISKRHAIVENPHHQVHRCAVSVFVYKAVLAAAVVAVEAFARQHAVIDMDFTALIHALVGRPSVMMTSGHPIQRHVHYLGVFIVYLVDAASALYG